jgi:hypothetical protein
LKKISVFLVVFALFTGGLYAYEPPQGGQNLFLFGHPKFITSANSAAGGGIFSEGSYSINMNPALTAGLQCPSMDAGFTGLFDEKNSEIGGAMRLGLSYPTRIGVFTGGVQGVFTKLDEVPLGNIALFRLGFSRDVTDNLFFGFSFTGGMLSYTPAEDSYMAGDIGAWYRIRELLFLKNVRFAAVLQNIGKTFETKGSQKYEEGVTGFPGFLTPKAGVAASLFDANGIVVGVSSDIALPSLKNILFNAGVQASIKDFVFISAGWDFNVGEAIDYKDKDPVHTPYIGIGVRFSVNTAGNETMSKRGFNETTIDADGLWQKLGGGVQAVSFGAAASFGVKDLLPPDISVGEVRYE